MASNIYPLGLEKIIEQGLDTMTCFLALLSNETATYIYDSTDEFFDTGSGTAAENPKSCECTLTSDGYVQGGQATTPTINLVVGSTRIEIVLDDETWSSLGGAVNNETITAAILYDDTGTDTTSPLLAYFDISNVTTTDQDFTLDFDAAGNIRIPYTIA